MAYCSFYLYYVFLQLINKLKFMKINIFARKERQLINKINKLNILVEKKNSLLNDEINDLIFKIKRLIKFLVNKIPTQKLSQISALFFLIFGLSVSDNLNAQTFAAPVLNPAGISIDTLSQWGKAELVDLDDDGDLDVLFSNAQYDYNNYSYNNGFTYEENLNPGFSLPFTNPFNLQSPFIFTDFSVLSHNLIDLDNDGDYDILSNLSGVYETYDYSTYQYSIDLNSSFRYFENIGDPTLPLYAMPFTNPFGLFNDSSVVFSDIIDIDGDGDLDIISINNILDYSTYSFTAELSFIENIGDANNPIFSNPQLNPFSLNGFEFGSSPAFTDIDGDGDLDLFVLESYDDVNFKYRQNKGTLTNPLFQSSVTNPFGLLPDTSISSIGSAPEFGDIDNDGDMDLIVGSELGVFFYQNMGSTTYINELENEIVVFPNPARDIINIKSEYIFDKLEVSDINGRIIISKNNPSNSIKTNTLNRGTYSLTLHKGSLKKTILFIKN